MEEARKVNIINIAGHHFCPGIRISMYNAMPVEGVTQLCKLMRSFMQRYPDTRQGARL